MKGMFCSSKQPFPGEESVACDTGSGCEEDYLFTGDKKYFLQCLKCCFQIEQAFLDLVYFFFFSAYFSVEIW